MKFRYAVVAVVGAAFLATAATAATAATGARTFGDGMYRVPGDVRPGTYRAANVDSGLGGCYWARLRNFSGSLNSIIANGNESAPALVTIKSTDRGFESNDCNRWTSDLRRITKSRTRFGAARTSSAWTSRRGRTPLALGRAATGRDSVHSQADLNRSSRMETHAGGRSSPSRARIVDSNPTSAVLGLVDSRRRGGAQR